MIKPIGMANVNFRADKQTIDKQTGEYVDPMMKWPLRGAAFTNEVGEALRPIIGGAANLTWVPALMYIGADVYDKYKNEVGLKPYAVELLDYFRSEGIKLGIASSNAIDMIEVCLDSNGIRDRFDVIVTSDQAERGKPYPDVYLLAAERLGAEPERCLVFEDIPAGIMAAKAAGMKAVAVYDRFSEEADAEKHRLADMYCQDFSDFMKAEGIITD